MYHGIINVYKEPGYTSHDVVARLRGILKQKKDRPYRYSRSGGRRGSAGMSGDGNQALRYAGRPDKDL